MISLDKQGDVAVLTMTDGGKPLEHNIRAAL